LTTAFLNRIRDALAGERLDRTGGDPAPEIALTGEGALASCFDVTGLATASIAAAGIELARLAVSEKGVLPGVEVDRRLASMWFGFSIRPVGWSLPSPWDPIAGDYRVCDGWIRLHTNAPHHRAAALSVLGVEDQKDVPAERKDVEAAVAAWSGEALEAAVVAAGGCAAQMRSEAAWREHPQGRAVRNEPLIGWRTVTCAKPTRKAGSSRAPLAGIRVLDLTRVLAGPVATRFLAAYGADVLRIDPPDWEEPGVVPEVTVGKRCAGLDLDRAADRERFESLLADADVLVHGYRPGALARHGYDEAKIREVNPGLVDVALCAYGWTGPWSERRGFDSLVQMSSGLAEAGMRWSGSERPTPLPVQALDHATGYLMAAAALRGLWLRRERGLAATARLSLARTAWLLAELGSAPSAPAIAAETAADVAATVEPTEWGPVRRLRFPLRIEGRVARFAQPARSLRSAPAQWSGQER
jgi:hypothetical protein